jgi:nitrite reductase/ring-hydroxylating ferredoxin subunit
MSKKKWVVISRVDEIEPDDSKRCQHGKRCIALFNLGGRIYATDDICTHAHAHLSEGYIDGETVECPLHQGLFHIPTGRPLSPPVTKPLETYPVKIEGGEVLVEIPDHE